MGVGEGLNPPLRAATVQPRRVARALRHSLHPVDAAMAACGGACSMGADPRIEAQTVVGFEGFRMQ
jgi:hypothetical protein